MCHTVTMGYKAMAINNLRSKRRESDLLLKPRRFRPALFWAGSILLMTACTEFGPRERQALSMAGQEYNEGKHVSAAARLDRLINDYSGAAEIGEAYYLRGLCRAKAGQAEAARGDFDAALEHSKRDDLTGRANASLGTIAFDRGQWSTAAEYFGKAIPKLPDAPPKDQILFSAAVASQRAGNWKQGTLYLSMLLRNFHNRPVAVEARRLATWQHQCFSIQLGVYRNSSNAQEAMKDYRRKGLDPDQENVPRGGEAVWIVRTGHYLTYAQATAALASVRRIEPKAYIIP